MSRPSHADFCNKDHSPGISPCARIVPSTLRAIELAAMKDGDRVLDATGDWWTKKDGKWRCFDAHASNESLIHVWGPIVAEDKA